MEPRDDVAVPGTRPATTFGWQGAFGLLVWTLAILFAAWTGGSSLDWTEKGVASADVPSQAIAMNNR